MKSCLPSKARENKARSVWSTADRERDGTVVRRFLLVAHAAVSSEAVSGFLRIQLADARLPRLSYTRDYRPAAVYGKATKQTRSKN